MTRWNPEALDRMAKMYRGGETLAVIAAAFDVSRGVIAGLVSRNPERFPKGAVPRKPGPPKKPASETAKAAKKAKSGKAGRGRRCAVELGHNHAMIGAWNKVYLRRA